MTKNRIFRLVRDDEVDQIAEIAVRAWTPIFEGYRQAMGEDLFNRYHRDWRARKSGEVKNAAKTRPGMVWVTEIDGRIVGFATFKIDEDRRIGEICNNAVDPKYQGRGIGKAQHRHILRVLKDDGLSHAIVKTEMDDGHAAARASYEKIGFKPMSSSVTYFMEL